MREIVKKLPGQTTDACRLRLQRLGEDGKIEKGSRRTCRLWKPDEDTLLARLRLYGTHFKDVAKSFPGPTPGACRSCFSGLKLAKISKLASISSKKSLANSDKR